MKASKKDSAPQKLSPFDFIGSINDGPSGKNLLAGCYADNSESHIPDSPDKAYVPFIINRGLSYFTDTILYANAMNERAHLPAKMQFDFLRFGVRPRKRFSKWAKKTDDTEDVALIMKRYGYSSEKARDALKLFSADALDEMRAASETGGLNKKKKS